MACCAAVKEGWNTPIIQRYKILQDIVQFRKKEDLCCQIMDTAQKILNKHFFNLKIMYFSRFIYL